MILNWQNLKRLSFLFFVFVLIFLLSASLFAKEIEYPSVPGAPPPGEGTTFPEYVKYLFNFAIAIGGMIALAVIVWAGILYFISPTSIERREEAKRKIIRALFGLAILLGTYIILVTINPQLTILGIPSISPPSPPSPPPPPPIPSTEFKEIPLGTLVENILAKNISCFDKDRNLIDCQESQCFATTTGYVCQGGEKLEEKATNEFAPETNFRYCYRYESDTIAAPYSDTASENYGTYSPYNGSYIYDYSYKAELLEYKDQYECLRNLLSALRKSSEGLEILIGELIDRSSELDALANYFREKAEELKDKSSDLNDYVQNDCKCSNCNHCCNSRGCGGCTCNCSCFGDPCTKIIRNEMNKLRETILPDLITKIKNATTSIREKEVEVQEVKAKIRAFIYGADPEEDKPFYCTSSANALSNWKSYCDSLANPEPWQEVYCKDSPDNPWKTHCQEDFWQTIDVNLNPQFLSLNEGKERLKKFIDELKKDLTDLKEAEDLMKSPYGDRLTLMEFLDIKKKEERKVNIQKFKNYNIDKFCFEFNCLSFTSNPTLCPPGSDTGDICNKCEVTNEGRMCKEFLFEGDPATFYYHSQYDQEEVLAKEKCTIDQRKEDGFLVGLIPIGQAVDETEEFATNTISQLQLFFQEIESIKGEALDSRNLAQEQINNIEEMINTVLNNEIPNVKQPNPPDVTDNDLIDYTSPGSDNTVDCVDDCSLVCSSPCTPTDTGECCDSETICDEEGNCTEVCHANYYNCICQTCSGTPCPYSTIQSYYNAISSAYTTAKGYYDNSNEKYDSIEDNYHNIDTSLKDNLPSYFNGFKDLIEAKTSPNRCKILHKLINSRRKLRECFTGYGFAQKKGKVKKRVFSSRIGLDLYFGENLVILPDDFFYPSGENCINAYPYDSPKLTNTEKDNCRKNKDSTDCWEAIRDFLSDFYCCEKLD